MKTIVKDFKCKKRVSHPITGDRLRISYYQVKDRQTGRVIKTYKKTYHLMIFITGQKNKYIVEKVYLYS